MNQWKLTDLTVKNIIFTDESVKGQITDSISENLTDSNLESLHANPSHSGPIRISLSSRSMKIDFQPICIEQDWKTFFGFAWTGTDEILSEISTRVEYEILLFTTVETCEKIMSMFDVGKNFYNVIRIRKEWGISHPQILDSWLHFILCKSEICFRVKTKHFELFRKKM